MGEKKWHIGMSYVLRVAWCPECVTTLVLGLRPRKGLANVWAKSEAQKLHFMLPRVLENVKA